MSRVPGDRHCDDPGCNLVWVGGEAKWTHKSMYVPPAASGGPSEEARKQAYRIWRERIKDFAPCETIDAMLDAAYAVDGLRVPPPTESAYNALTRAAQTLTALRDRADREAWDEQVQRQLESVEAQVHLARHPEMVVPPAAPATECQSCGEVAEPRCQCGAALRPTSPAGE